MKHFKIRIPTTVRKWIWPTLIVGVIVLGTMTRRTWFPVVSDWVDSTVSRFGTGEVEEVAEAPGGGGEVTSLDLSDQALRNIGLSSDSIRPIELETYRRSITVPAVVVERPGRTQVQVATPMTGVITHVHLSLIHISEPTRPY